MGECFFERACCASSSLRSSSKATPLNAAERKKSGGCCWAIGFEQIFDDAQNVLSPVAWQLADFFKYAAGFSDRAAASGCFVAAQEGVSRHGKRTGQGVNLIGSERNRFTLPVGNYPLGDVYLVGQFLLGQSGGLTGLRNALAQGGAWL